MKNIHVLPTKDSLPVQSILPHLKNYEELNYIHKHIYITSDEEIKEEEWCILLENHYVNGGIGKYNTEKAIGYGLHNTEFFKKIILNNRPRFNQRRC